MSAGTAIIEGAACLALWTVFFRVGRRMYGELGMRRFGAKEALLALQTTLLCALLLTLGAIWAGAHSFRQGGLFAGGLCAAIVVWDALLLSKRRDGRRLLRAAAILVLLSALTGGLVEVMV